MMSDVELLQFIFCGGCMGQLSSPYKLFTEYLQNLPIHAKYGINGNQYEKCFDKWVLHSYQHNCSVETTPRFHLQVKTF